MAQVDDYILDNQGFATFRTELNNILSAINTSNLGTSAPNSVGQGTLWVDSGTTGKLKVKVVTQQYPESSEKNTKEFDVTQLTEKVNFRARGRQAKIRVSCNSQNASWQWGAVRLGFKPDGER